MVIGTPVDLRIGFPAGDKLLIEPRLGFSYNSKGGTVTVGGTTNTYATYHFIPDVNALWALGSNKKGPYLTAGAGVDLYPFVTTLSQFSVNGGVGIRMPYEPGAIRLEAVTQHFFQNTDDGLVGLFTIGARLGISLRH